MPAKDGLTKRLKCTYCGFRTPEMDFPENDATWHLRDHHQDVLNAQGNFRPGDILESHFRELKRIVGRVRTT